MFAALPPSSSVSATFAARELALDCLADLRGARERDLVDAVVLDEMCAGRSVSRDDVDDSGRQLRLPAHVREEQRRQRGRLGRLEHDRVAAREGGRDLPREHEQREVPGDDLPGDAERARPAVREGVFELVGPARVVEEVCGRQRQVDVARLLDRLAAVERLGDGQLPRALLQDAGDPEQVLGALRRSQLRPPVDEGVACGPDGEVDVLGACLRHLGQHLLARRRDGGKPLPRARLDLFAPDEQAVALPELDDVARLGCGRVLPLERRGHGLTLLRDLAHVSRL